MDCSQPWGCQPCFQAWDCSQPWDCQSCFQPWDCSQPWGCSQLWGSFLLWDFLQPWGCSQPLANEGPLVLLHSSSSSWQPVLLQRVLFQQVLLQHSSAPADADTDAWARHLTMQPCSWVRLPRSWAP